jgi:hypothetical protein
MQPGDDMPAFIATVSRRRTAPLVLGAILFVIVGVGMLRDPRGGLFLTIFGWAAILFFGLAGLVGVRQLFSSGPDTRIDGQGIWWRRWSDQRIPWDAIAALYPAGVGRTSLLCLTLVDRDAYPSTRVMGKFAGLNRASGFGDIAVGVTGTDRSFAELVEAVERFAPRALLEPRPPARPEIR